MTKKFSILFAILALVLASLACQSYPAAVISARSPGYPLNQGE